MKTQIADLEDKIKNLPSTGPATPDSSGAPQATGGDAQQGGKTSEAAKELKTEQTESKATADYKMFSEDEEAAARYDNVPLDPRYPNYFRLPGTKTFMKIGGYAKSDLTFDPRPAGDQERFIPASIPIPAPAANVSNSTVSVRPSRINVDFLVPIEKERALRFFFEMDFFGSSSTTPRLRHVYAQGKNVLIGQTFSNFMDPDAGPDTLDFQGPNSQVSIRNPQVRYTHRFGKATTASISVEKASSDVAFKTPDFNAQPNSPSPDGTVQIRHEMSRGHVQFAGLFRDISASLPDGRSDSVFGWGFNLAGLFKTIGKDAFVYHGAYGNGIERYINDTSGLGIDAAVISVQNPHLEAVPAIAT
ncbi:MAG TPA: DcaP family trimeric outer membrane transporter, partial [Candidatus Angelobacter sp.]